MVTFFVWPSVPEAGAAGVGEVFLPELPDGVLLPLPEEALFAEALLPEGLLLFAGVLLPPEGVLLLFAEVLSPEGALLLFAGAMLPEGALLLFAGVLPPPEEEPSEPLPFVCPLLCEGCGS